jgi:hypothetical protein
LSADCPAQEGKTLLENVLLGNFERLALVDSGATVNCISSKCASEVEAALEPIDDVNITAAGGHKLKCLGQTNLSITLKGRRFSLRFFILELDRLSQGADLILGTPFLKAQNPDIDWSTLTLAWRKTKSLPATRAGCNPLAKPWTPQVKTAKPWTAPQDKSQSYFLKPDVLHNALAELKVTLSADLFASQAHHQHPIFFSSKPEPGDAQGVDAFAQDWVALAGKGRLPLANPPWGLIPQVLDKIRRDRALVVMVTPQWRSAPWGESLKQLTQSSVVLPTQELYTTLEGKKLPPPQWTTQVSIVGFPPSTAKPSLKKKNPPLKDFPSPMTMPSLKKKTTSTPEVGAFKSRSRIARRACLLPLP